MARRKTEPDPEPPEPRGYVAELQAHVAQFGHAGIVDAIIANMRDDDAKSILETIKGHKIADESSEGDEPSETE